MKQGKNMEQKHQEKSRCVGMSGFMLTRAYSSRIQRFFISLLSRWRNKLLHGCIRTLDVSYGFLIFIVLQITKKKKTQGGGKKKERKAYLMFRFQMLIKINSLVRKVLNYQLPGYFVYIARQVLNICCIMLSILSFEQDRLCTGHALGLQ